MDDRFLSAIDVQTVVVVYPHYWGKGASIKEAEAQAKKAGYMPSRRKKVKGELESVLYFFESAQEDVKAAGGIGVSFEWPAGKVAMRIERHW